MNYKNGFFLIHWTFAWIICMFTLIEPIYEVLMTGYNDVLVAVIVFVMAVIIALIPAIFLTCCQKISNNYISVFHYMSCTQDLWYIRAILRLHVIRGSIYHSNIRMCVAFVVYFLYIVNIFSYLFIKIN